MSETKENTPKKDSESTENTTQINFRIPARTPSVVAQHMSISESNGETVLMFFEIIQPVLPIDEEQRQEAQEHLNKTGLVAECVTRVTFSSHRLPEFAKAFGSISDGFQAQIHQMEEDYAKSIKDSSET